MRMTTVGNKLLGLQGVWVRGFECWTGRKRIVLEVAPRARVARCGQCGQKVRSVKDRKTHFWRHLDLFGTRTYRAGFAGPCAPDSSRSNGSPG